MCNPRILQSCSRISRCASLPAYTTSIQQTRSWSSPSLVLLYDDGRSSPRSEWNTVVQSLRRFLCLFFTVGVVGGASKTLTTVGLWYYGILYFDYILYIIVLWTFETPHAHDKTTKKVETFLIESLNFVERLYICNGISS